MDGYPSPSHDNVIPSGAGDLLVTSLQQGGAKSRFLAGARNDNVVGLR